MHSFTPRTCLWPLTGALICTFALSIGLTFQSNHHCFAGVCGEWLFPFQARLHVVVWYSWLSISVTILAVRAFHPRMRAVLRRPLIHPKLPVLGKQLTVSGVLVFTWILTLYGILTAVWWHRLDAYFVRRGQGSEETARADKLLAAIAQTGHYADVSMGLALIPVSRHSALASFFKLSVSTTLAFHMLTAYTLFALVLIHTFLYIAWLPTVTELYSRSIRVFPVLNPTYLYNEVWPGNPSSLGIWRASLVFTGAGAALIMAVLSVTTLPWVRKHQFNTFYFTHIFSIVAVIIVCLHASTIFYCTAPGLAMIILDWGMRFYELREPLPAKVTDLTRGWYMVSLELPRKRLNGCACRSPLAHFYLHHGTSSLRELHPFTTITHLSSQSKATSYNSTTLSIQFLFRKQGFKPIAQIKDIDKREGDVEAHKGCPVTPTRLVTSVKGLFQRQERRRHVQWTAKVASLVAENRPEQHVEADDSSPKVSDVEQSIELHKPVLATADTKIRLEGPYFTPSDPAQYTSVLCLVAGTGVSGALAVAAAFAAQDNKRDDIRRPSVGEVNLAHMNSSRPSDATGTLQVDTPSTTTQAQSRLTSSEKDASASWTKTLVIWSVRATDYIKLPFPSASGLTIQPHLTGTGGCGMRLDMRAAVRTARDSRPDEKVWVYISGPGAFIAAAEAACKAESVDYYGARWDI